MRDSAHGLCPRTLLRACQVPLAAVSARAALAAVAMFVPWRQARRGRGRLDHDPVNRKGLTGTATSLETARVLIADDHPLIRLAVRRELESAGFEVCGESGDATAAVADALEAEPDVCLLDVHMPGGGIDTVLRIKSMLPRTKIVMLTSAEDESDLVDVLAAGASGYVGKESEPARLPHVLRAVLRGEVAVPRSFVSTLVERLVASR